MCVGVSRKFIKNSAKHISNEQINASLMCFHILDQGVPQEYGKHISDSVCNGNLFHNTDQECGN